MFPWNLPGGKLLPGETPKQAAVRETLEETGVATLTLEFVLVSSIRVEGIDWLAKQGMRCRSVSAGQFEQDFKGAMAHQRQLVLDAPLKGTFVTLWRAATKQVPFVGPLAQQSIASEQLVSLRGAHPIRA